MSVAEVIDKAYKHAITPSKIFHLIQSSLQRSGDRAEVATALLHRTLTPSPPSLILSYLTAIASSDHDLGNAIIERLLLLLSSTSTSTDLVPIASALLASTWASDITPLPGILENAATISYTQPLLLASTLTNSHTITSLTARILAAIPPYPAPPVDVGLELTSLLPLLPEIIGQHLRTALGGLMAELSISNTTIDPPPIDDSTDLPTLPSPFSGPAPIPITHAIAFLLTYLQREARYARQVEEGVWSTHLDILRVGRALRVDSSTFLLHLVEGAILGVLDRYQNLGKEYEDAIVFLVEHLPSLLKWWKVHGKAEWPFPTNASECIKAALDTHASALQEAWSHLEREHESRVTQAEDDEGVPDAPIRPCAETLLRKLVQVGVMDEAGVEPLPSLGESLLDRLLECSPAARPLVELAIIAGPATQRPFATSVLSCIRAVPTTPPPENLLTLLTSPALLSALTTIITPAALLDVLVERLLLAPIDESLRADDPQGVLTRFGEGVVLVEAAVHAFDMDLPEVLAKSRRAVALRDLSKEHTSCLSGWIKALFGSEGIDDQIIMSTAPHDFCWLATTVIQQAIAALAVGQLDIDALHSGLSYFSQPLLSWCLGGIVSWLCNEIIRNGVISALHLDVLQSLVLGDAFPDALLRVNARAIARIIEPSEGLGEVLQKAGFDIASVKSRLEGMNAYIDTNNTLHPINVLRSNIQICRHLEMTTPTWPHSFFIDFSNTHSRVQPAEAAKAVVAEILHPSMEYDATLGDPLSVFSAMLSVLPIDGRPPLVAATIRESLTDVLTLALGVNTGQHGQHGQGRVALMAGRFKTTLILFAELNPRGAEYLMGECVRRLDMLAGSTGPAGRERDRDNDNGRRRRRRQGDGLAEFARAIVKAMRADEELGVMAPRI